MRSKSGQCGQREEGYHPYIDAIERGEVEPTLTELRKMCELLEIDPAVYVTPRNVPCERLEFLSDFIKYLEGVDEPKHLRAIQVLVTDAMQELKIREWARPIMIEERKRAIMERGRA